MTWVCVQDIATMMVITPDAGAGFEVLECIELAHKLKWT
jgi:hypothetical protein